MRSYAGRVAVVTGAGSGIGRALACRLATDGARVAISDADPDGLAVTADRARRLGDVIAVDRVDVTDREEMTRYAATLAAAAGGASVLINNAGVAHGGMFSGMSFADIDRVLSVDLGGVLNGTKVFLPQLIASGRGSLVNISSVFGLVPFPGQSAYVAAKYAVRGFTESIRIEMLAAGHPVTVTCVHPGGVATAIARNGTVNDGDDPAGSVEIFERRLARTSPDRAAQVILRAAARGRPRVLVGTDAWAIHLVGGLSLRTWQRATATIAARRSPSLPNRGGTVPNGRQRPAE